MPLAAWTDWSFPMSIQGLTLAVPEMVPFRLTQNLVDAFGVSGYEGAFRRACEVTLQVQRLLHMLAASQCQKACHLLAIS